MSLFDPLRRFLCLQRSEQLDMSFEEIERIIGHALPANANSPLWWSLLGQGEDDPAVAWRKAGYKAHLSAPKKVVFRRIAARSPDHPG